MKHLTIKIILISEQADVVAYTLAIGKLVPFMKKTMLSVKKQASLRMLDHTRLDHSQGHFYNQANGFSKAKISLFPIIIQVDY